MLSAAFWQGNFNESKIQTGGPLDEHCKTYTFRECELLVKPDSRFISVWGTFAKWTDTQRFQWLKKWFLLYSREIKWFMSLSANGYAFKIKILPIQSFMNCKWNSKWCICTHVCMHICILVLKLSLLCLCDLEANSTVCLHWGGKIIVIMMPNSHFQDKPNLCSIRVMQ